MTSKLEQAIANATSSDMYAYLITTINETGWFTQHKEFVNMVGDTNGDDETYREQLIELVNEVNEWATEAYNNGEEDYYPYSKYTFLNMRDKYYV